MKSIILYIIVMIILGIRSYLQNKAKQQAMQEASDDEETEAEGTDDNETEESFGEINEQERSAQEILAEIIEKAQVATAERESLTTEAVRAKMFEEGSDRKQHSNQYEASPRKPMTDHDMHEDYNSEKEEEGNGIEMTPEKMRQALIYQTIIERPEY